MPMPRLGKGRELKKVLEIMNVNFFSFLRNRLDQGSATLLSHWRTKMAWRESSVLQNPGPIVIPSEPQANRGISIDRESPPCQNAQPTDKAISERNSFSESLSSGNRSTPYSDPSTRRGLPQDDNGMGATQGGATLLSHWRAKVTRLFQSGLDFSPKFRSRGVRFQGLKSLPLSLLFTSLLTAAEKPTIIIPYDSAIPVSSQQAKRVYIDYETFQAMWKKVKNYRATESGDAIKSPNDFTLSTAMYRIRSSEKRLSVTGKISLTTRGTEWQKIPLPFKNANLSKITLDGKAASYQGGAIIVETPGNHLLEVEYEITLDKTTAAAKWSIPSAGATLLEIEMDSLLAEPVLQQNWPLAKSDGKFFGPGGSSTFYTAAIGQQREIQFRRRLKTSGRDMTRPNVADIDARLFIAPGLERLEATYHLQFEGQEENRFTIGFDESITPVQFEIPNLASWEMGRSETDPGIKTLTFSLSLAVRDKIDVRLIGERLLNVDADGVEQTFPRFSADASRIEQRLSLLRVNELSIKTTPGAKHRQINFAMSRDEQAGFHPVASYSLTGGNDVLKYRAQEVKPERKITASYLYQVGAGKLETIARFQIRSPEAPLLSSTLKIPTDAKIQIVSGNRIKDWWRTGDELFVRYSGGTPKSTNLLVYVAQQLGDDNQDSVPVVPFPFVGMKNEDVSGAGLIVAHVTRDTSLQLNETRQVVREIGIDEVGDDSEILAPLERKRGFRFERMNFSGEIYLTKIEPKFDAVWVMLAQMHENWTRLSIHVDIEVTKSGLNRVRFTTPEAMPELRVLSDEVREMRHTLADGVRQYEIVFQQFVTDAIAFTLEAEIPHDGTITIPDLAIPDASRQERFIIVENQSSEKMSLEPVGMETTVPSLLPYKPAALRTAQIFRARPDWSLQAGIEQLETTAGNQAVILYASLTTAFRSNGEEWLKAVYHMQNRSLQFLPVQLPEESELISVIVAGSEVRADRGTVEGKPVILVPLIQTKPGQLAYDVELVLRSQREVINNSKPVTKLKRKLNDPAVFGITIETTLWNVFLPKGHEITDFDSNMQQVQAEENIATILQCNLTELGQLNYIGGDFDNGLGVRKASVSNGDVLVQRIENDLKRLDRSRGYQDRNNEKFRKDFDKQKAAAVLNRVNITKGNGGISVATQNGNMQVDWGMGNSGKIVTRNTFNINKSSSQVERVESQVRLNDNISISDKFVGKDTEAEGKGSEKKMESSENNYSQIGRLAGNGSVNEASKKLSKLSEVQSFAQIGHGGFSAGKEDAAKKPAKKSKSKAVIKGNSRSLLNRVSPGAKKSQLQQDQSAQSGLISSNDYAALEQETLRAEGRNSVSIEFPVEGEAVYFQKLKGHAEISLSSVLPSNSEKGKYFLWLLGIVTVLLAGRELLARRLISNPKS